MRKILKILLIIPVLYLIAVPVYLAGSIGSKRCESISIDIKDSADYHFVTRRQLRSMVYGSSQNVLGKRLKDIDAGAIEKRLGTLRELKTAEVYKTVDGRLHVSVDQRNPLMRVMPDGGGDFFLDEDGILVRKRNMYNPRLHIVEGNITITQAMLDGHSVLDTAMKNTILKDIYYLVDYIDNDKFWSAMIDQVYVDKNNEIDIIPRVGNLTIHLGTADNFRDKLKNLEVFYEKVMPEVGWDKYSEINLEFRDQIVCKRR
jgi:cell division protein FtsQ